MGLAMVLFGLASAGYAACWGPGQRTAEISRTEYQLKGADGPRRVVLVYEVFMRGEVCERGAFGEWRDGRICAAVPYERRFVRTVQVYSASGAKSEPATRIQRVEMAPELSRDGPCTQYAVELTNAFWAAQTGTADGEWKAHIQQDEQLVRRELALIGLVLPGT
jgi:hypothetical protein